MFFSFLQDESEPGLVEKAQLSVCEIIYLYALRYEEEFPSLPAFVDIILQLLSSVTLEPKFDHVI